MLAITFKGGNRLVKMKDVAERAGVSLITVSRVLNYPDKVKEETRQRVEKAVKELNFIPNFTAKALAENKTRSVYLYIPQDFPISDPFSMNLIAGIMEKLSEKQYSLQITRELDIPQKCDGIILMGLKDYEYDKLDKKINVPYVLFGKGDSSMNWIDIDNYNGAYEMTTYLINQGHRNIGFLKIDEDIRYAVDRFEGYKDALIDNGLNISNIEYADNSEHGGYVATKALLKCKNITAVFSSTDIMALGSGRAIKEQGLSIPHDISVVGFDGLLFDLIAEEPLSTVKQPINLAGKNLADLLIKTINNPNRRFEQTLIKPELIIRKSVKNINKG